MWRRGPQGAGTLCNACGVKWKHGKILNGSNTTATAETISHQQEYTPQRRGSSNAKGSDKKRKRSSASSSSSGSGKRVANKKRATSISQTVTDSMYYDTFAVPAPMMPTSAQQQWEGQSAASSSTTSDSRSPLESFSSSPNTSPSIATLMDGQDIKRDILMSYDTETLSVYVGEDAVEAAAVLTLLKRS